MNSTTSARGRLARAVAMQLLKRLTGGTIHLVDTFGDARFGDDTAPQALPPIDVTVRVRDTRAYSRILHEGSVGLGESYADGWWDTDDLSGFLRLAHRSLARTHIARDRIHSWLRPVVDPIARRRRADQDRDARNVRAHYDLGNEFFQRILDETIAVAAKSGVALSRETLLQTARRLGEAMIDALSSTAQDLLQGKPTEIDSLNGLVADLGRQYGVATPVNRTLHALVKLAEQVRVGTNGPRSSR